LSDFENAQSLLEKEKGRSVKSGGKKKRKRGCPLHMEDGVCRMSLEIPSKGDHIIPFLCTCQDYYESCGVYIRHGKA